MVNLSKVCAHTTILKLGSGNGVASAMPFFLNLNGAIAGMGMHRKYL